jgi:hypothetical protein
MKSRFRAMGALRTVRDRLGRLNRVLMEAGSSDEDLVFHIRKSESGGLRRDQITQTLDRPRP